MSEKRSSYQYRQSLSFIDKKPKFLQNFLQPTRADRSEDEIEKLRKEKQKDNYDDEQPQIVVLNEEKDLSKEEIEQYLINNPDKKISEEIILEKSKEDNEDSKFNKIFQNKKTTYSKDYKGEQKDKIKNNYKKNNDIDYNEYTFGNEIKQDTTSKEKVIFRKPSSRKDDNDNDLISSSKKSIKRKIISDKNEKEDNITNKNSEGSNKKNKNKKHKKAKAQQSLLSFSMDD